MTREGMREFGTTLVQDLKNSARQADIQPSSGTLFGSGIRYEQRGKSNQGEVFMRQYGIYLDSMAPHFVSIKASRSRLLSWAQRARSKGIRKKANLVAAGKLPSYSIYVKPHPFIERGYRRARRKLPLILQRAASRAVNGA